MRILRTRVILSNCTTFTLIASFKHDLHFVTLPLLPALNIFWQIVWGRDDTYRNILNSFMTKVPMICSANQWTGFCVIGTSVMKELRPCQTSTLREKCPNTEFSLVRIFPHSDWIRKDTSYLSVFSPNAGKYGPEKTPYLDTFHTVLWWNFLRK